MIKNFIKGIQIGLGFIFVISIIFGIVYAVGFHTAEEVLPGTFTGNYTFTGNLTVNDKIYGEVMNLYTIDGSIYHKTVAEAWCINVAMNAGKADYTYGILWSPGGTSCDTTCTTNSWSSALARLEMTAPQGNTETGFGWRQGGTTRTNPSFCCCAN